MIETRDFLNRFENVKPMGQGKYQATCPCHDDKQASLTITISSKKILLHCHAGCETANILNAIDLTLRTLKSVGFLMTNFLT